jgi:2-(1,2-epoxy-1,2-dihydrophenyl)acetyl-CoA isomerase
MVLALRDMAVPLVTAVRGAAVGGGSAIALMGDVIVAGEGAYFLQSFARIGLVPDAGTPWLLARSVGRVRAMEMMLLGERLPAAQALAWGLVTRVVPDTDVESVAMKFARKLAAGPTAALAMTRRLGWAALENTLAQELAEERDFQREAGWHPDFREGVIAFLKKRAPRFGQR